MQSSMETSTTTEEERYLYLEIDSAHLTKNVNGFLGRMDPFVQLEMMGDASDGPTIPTNCTSTHWDAHFDPRWSYTCPGIPLSTTNERVIQFTVLDDSELNRHPGLLPKADATTSNFMSGMISKATGAKRIGQVAITVNDLLDKAGPLELRDETGAVVGTLQINAQTKSISKSSATSNDPSMQNESVIYKVDPSWFESPVKPFSTSGGTAAFFQLTLTDAGIAASQQTTPSFYVGKDLSHAADEKEFYQKLLQIKNGNDKEEDVALLIDFMFEYLGILEAASSVSGGEMHQLLVLQNLRNDYQRFRMLDLKIGEVTAQAGWKGKSRLTAMKCHLLNDPFTNSASEGYRLAGFDGTCKVFDSLDPLIDFLVVDGEHQQSDDKKTVWGTHVDEQTQKKAQRLMINMLTGTEVLGYFLDVHTDQDPTQVMDAINEKYTPIEMIEVVSRELVSRLVQVSLACHRIKTPQKWIGSSVALGYDAGLLPSRSSIQDAEDIIRSKVIVNLFDWGRSELLTRRQFQTLTPAEKSDRKLFWCNYKAGMDRLAFNTARAYYHQFTNADRWTMLTLQVMDFDSTSKDDYIGTVTISLPDPYDSEDAATVADLQQCKVYELTGSNQASACGSTVSCSISWLELPPASRLLGCWRVTIERAANLPVMDLTNSSDPYCLVIANNHSVSREFYQRTCVKAQCLNPHWNETIDVPVMKSNGASTSLLGSAMALQGPFAISEEEMARFFQWDDDQQSSCGEASALKEWSQTVVSSVRRGSETIGAFKISEQTGTVVNNRDAPVVEANKQ